MRVVVGVGVLFVGLGIASAAPLDKPAFTATGAELIAEARAAPAGDTPVIALREDHSWTFDASGRAETRSRIVVAIRTAAAVDDWGSFETTWRPFYQERPLVRARVIAPNGDVAELDPKLVTDAPSVTDSPTVFSDRRELKAPLPRLVIGAVIEEEIVTRDREPLLASGTADTFSVGASSFPVQHTTVTISAPTRRPAKIVVRGFAKAPIARRDDRAGRSTWTYDIGPTPRHDRDKDGIPRDVVTWPYIGVSTAASWTAVAADYKRIVDQRLAAAIDLPAGVTGATERETVDRILAWLHAHVRYTGIELADAAIVPAAPAETVMRGFGDCKDKATLLVAMLRKAGIRADVVLLDSGAGFDFDHDLPGMVFDHAIVRAVVGGKDLWIDATEDLLPAGYLPARDEDRGALLIAADTRALMITPASVAADNVLHQTRRFELPEAGRGKVTQIARTTGALADRYRRWIRDTSHEDVTKWITAMVESTYRGKLARFSNTNADDIATPFAFTVEVDHARRAETLTGRVDAYVFSVATFHDLPDILTSTSAQTTRDVEARTADYAWFQPHVNEVENRFVVPTGYTMPVLAADDRQELGAMTLTTTRRVDNGELVITYRLDTGKRRITAKQLLATRKAVQTLTERDGEHVVIELTSAKLMDAGKIVEAIAEAQRLIALHPKHAAHYDQLSRIYLHVGLFEAARRTAKKAVEVEPTSGAGFVALAHVLSLDRTGHEFGFDSDRGAAIAAYRKAIAIIPDHHGAVDALARLLANDAHGLPTADDRERNEAIGLWKRMVADDPSSTAEASITQALIEGGHFAAGEVAARALRDSDQRSQLIVAAVAGQRGSAQALAVAGSLGTGDKAKSIARGAARILILSRHYRAGIAVITDLKLIADPDALALFEHLEPVEFAKLDPADPKTPIKKYLAWLVGVGSGASPWDPEIDHELTASATSKQFIAQLGSGLGAMPVPIMADVVAAGGSAAHSDGSPGEGWRIQIGSATPTILYVAFERGRAKLLGTPELPVGVAGHALALVQRGDLASARRWLDRLADDLAARHPDNAWAKAYRDDKARATMSKDTLELFAAIGATAYRARSAPVLRRCATSVEAIRKLCAQALISTDALAKDWVAVAASSRARVDADPTDDKALGQLVYALVQLHRVDDAAAAVDAAAAKLPASIALDWNRLAIETERDPAKASALIDTMSQRAGITSSELNNLAWSQLFVGATPAKARELGQRAKSSAKTIDDALANTLAAIEAESNDPAAAWPYLYQSIRSHRDNKPGDADDYVLGRIAETVGLRDDAIALYRLVSRSDEAGATAFHFAQRALRRLGVH